MATLRKQDWLTIAFLVILAIAFFVVFTFGCSQTNPAPAPQPTCDGTSIGSTRTLLCPPGQTGTEIQVCAQSAKWVEASNTCSATPTPPPAKCSVPVFADVQPILQTYCAGCHSALTGFNGVQSFGVAEILRRIALPTGDPQHMPQGTSPQMTPEQVQTLNRWSESGANQFCPASPVPGGSGPPPSFITEDYLVTAMNADALNLPVTDRPFVRYLVTGHAFNNGATAEYMRTFTDAINKAVNSLANESTTLTKAQPIEQAGVIWRIDLRNYGIGAAEIAAIEAADVNINIIDNTSKGQALQALIGTKKPWFHADNFIDITFRNSQVYYKVTNTPATLAALQTQLGVDWKLSFQQFTSRFIGSANSPIAEQKNRLIARTTQNRSVNNAYFWQTFDVNAHAGLITVTGNANAGSAILPVVSAAGIFAGQQVSDGGKAIAPGTTVLSVNAAALQVTISAAALVSVANDQLTFTPNKNLFQDPLLDGTGGVELFNSDASEVIYQTQNGLQGYALFDAAGNLLNFADPNVVIDTQTPLANKVINNANSCSRCHNVGIIPMVDQVLSAVTANASQYKAADVQLVLAFYKDAPSNAALFRTDNAEFAKSLASLGIDANKPDPMNVITDQFLLNWNLKQAASFLFLTPAQLAQAINTSPTAKDQIGALITPGGTVTFAQFTAVLQQLIKDANLFKDSVGG